MYSVDLHMHTVASAHTYSTLSDYIAQAKQKDIKFFAITDHDPDMENAPHHWHFINTRIWPRVVDGVGILRGVKASIENIGGETNCSGKIFDSLDLIIAGFHEPVFAPHDKATNTQVAITTIAGGNVHVIDHPRNPKYRVDVEAVAGATAKHQAALEISNSLFLHSRKDSEDNRRTVTVAVRSVGGWVALGSDSHTAFTMGELGERLKILDAIDFPPERILNASPRRLPDLLEFRGMAPIAEFADL